jgi:hypothetical protein
MQVAAVLPADPVYVQTRIPGLQRIITAGNAEDFPVLLSITLTDTQRKLIGERRTYFWVYASIRFFDFMGMKRETGFCWQWRTQSITVNTVDADPVISEAYGFSPMARIVPEAYIRRNRPCDEADT